MSIMSTAQSSWVNAIKLGQYNVGRDGEVLTVPLYMGFLVKDKLADVIIPDIDLSLLV